MPLALAVHAEPEISRLPLALLVVVGLACVGHPACDRDFRVWPERYTMYLAAAGGSSSNHSVRQTASRPAQKISQPSYSPVRSASAVRPITGPTSRPSWSGRWRMLGLATLGGALEFYDFIIFVFFANQIGQLFFPAERAISDVRTFCRRLFCAASVTLVIRLVGIDHLRKRVQVRPLAESDKRDLFLFGVHFQDGLFQDCDVFCGKEISNKKSKERPRGFH
jgi:hypothetical protein